MIRFQHVSSVPFTREAATVVDCRHHTELADLNLKAGCETLVLKRC